MYPDGWDPIDDGGPVEKFIGWIMFLSVMVMFYGFILFVIVCLITLAVTCIGGC